MLYIWRQIGFTMGGGLLVELLKWLEFANLQIRVVWYCYQLLTIYRAVKLVKENANAMNQTAWEGVLYS